MVGVLYLFNILCFSGGGSSDNIESSTQREKCLYNGGISQARQSEVKPVQYKSVEKDLRSELSETSESCAENAKTQQRKKYSDLTQKPFSDAQQAFSVDCANKTGTRPKCNPLRGCERASTCDTHLFCDEMSTSTNVRYDKANCNPHVPDSSIIVSPVPSVSNNGITVQNQPCHNVNLIDSSNATNSHNVGN